MLSAIANTGSGSSAASETTSYGMGETLSAPVWSPETYSAKLAYPRCNHYLQRRIGVEALRDLQRPADRSHRRKL